MEPMGINYESLEIKGMHPKFSSEKQFQVAYIPRDLFQDLKESPKQHLYIMAGKKKVFLNPRPMPTWDPFCKAKVIRLHEKTRASLDVNFGDFCKVALVNTLPELDFVSIRVAGLQGKMQRNLGNALKNYLIGNAIQEKSYIPLSIGFCRELNVEMCKTYPFSKGLIVEKTRLNVSKHEK